METGLKPMAKFVKTLKRHKEGILNHADYPINTSKLEGGFGKGVESSAGWRFTEGHNW